MAPTGRLFAALVCSMIALSSASTARAELTMADLTARQKAELERRMQFYATFSAALIYCGRDPRLADRLTKAVRKCVAAEDLAALSRRFKQLERAESQDFRVPASKLCKEPEYRRISDAAEARFEELVAEAYAMCRRCVIC